MKKFAIVFVFVMAFALTTTAVFAYGSRDYDRCCGDRHQQEQCCPETNVWTNNEAVVLNKVETDSDTGDNRIERTSRARITTGNATSFADVYNDVNNNDIDVQSASRGETNVGTNNGAFVFNFVETDSDTGDNKVEGSSYQQKTRCRTSRTSASGSIDTGDAASTSWAYTYANTNVIKVR